MADLQKFHAKICHTAAGYLIQNGRVLLIKHKKLGMWLAPGGHVEPEELPHQAAEREVWEETGITVKAIQAFDVPPSAVTTEILPTPAMSNLHWVCEANYHNRLASALPDQRHASKVWPRGCEQHLGQVFFVEPVDKAAIEFKQNVEETDGIAWFGLADIAGLETSADLKTELRWMLELAEKKGIG